MAELMKIRATVAAGTFYPQDPRALRTAVEDLLAAAKVPEIELHPTMVIVPHAGYIYSGPIAATAYSLLRDAPEIGRRVVLIGPSHFVGFAGLASPGVDALETPLGLVPVDRELAAKAAALALIAPEPAPHAREHSLEVQLPFLQVIFGEFTALPLATGQVTALAAAHVLDELLDDPEVLGVISSDLSHYLDYTTARKRDERTAELITGLQHDELRPDDACGRTAVQAALTLARKRGWRCRQLDLRNSGDTAGSRERVVGYGAFVIGPEA